MFWLHFRGAVTSPTYLYGLCFVPMQTPHNLMILLSFPSTVKPSKPRCYAEGPTLEGKDIVLRCVSSEGTSPLQYSWKKTSDTRLLPASAVLGNAPFLLHTQSIRTLLHQVIFLFDRVFLHVSFSFTTDPVGGTVNVRNASGVASGTYSCTVSNRVGTEECIMHLNVTPREYPNICVKTCSSALISTFDAHSMETFFFSQHL